MQIIITASGTPTVKVIAEKLPSYIVLTPDQITDSHREGAKIVYADGLGPDILTQFALAKKRAFCQNPFDWSGDMNAIRKHFAKMTLYGDLVVPGSPILQNEPTQTIKDEPATLDDLSGQIKQISKYISHNITGASIAELAAQTAKVCRDNQIFVYDIITGNIKTCLNGGTRLISQTVASNMFLTHFIDKLVIRGTGKFDTKTGKQVQSFRKATRHEVEIIWQNILLYSRYNGRRELYESIPEWDGTPRVATFLKDYMNCDANPNFFRLLMTALIGKIDDPASNYTPFFFDFVSNSKGIGKSLFCRRIIGNKYCSFLAMTSRRDDFYVNAYDSNTIVAVDDECTWIGKGFDKMTYDEFKQLITNPTDKFSRKFQQPEEHDRSFLILRTSNEPRQVWSSNERRQIIFQCNLQPNECRILDLPPEFWGQLRAEAKADYEKNGMYKLTAEDWKEVEKANLNNFNDETEEILSIRKFIAHCLSSLVDTQYSEKLYTNHKGGDIWLSWAGYTNWAKENKEPKIDSRNFWRSVEFLAKAHPDAISYTPAQRYLTETKQYKLLFCVHKNKANEMPDLEGIPDDF